MGDSPTDDDWSRTATAAVDFYEETVAWLEHHHAGYPRGTSHDLDAADRVNAVWKLAGQSLSLSRSLVHLLRDGYTAQTWPTLRAIHEANQILGPIADPNEDTIVERWLADKKVEQKKARAAGQREAERIAAQMEAAGLEPIAANVGELAATIYGGMSKAAHHQRSAVDEAVDAEQRTMIYGPDPRQRVRLEFVIFSGAVIQEVLLTVGDSLSRLYGPPFYEEHLLPMLTRFQEMLDALDMIDIANRLGI